MRITTGHAQTAEIKRQKRGKDRPEGGGSVRAKELDSRRPVKEHSESTFLTTNHENYSFNFRWKKKNKKEKVKRK